MNAYLRRKQRRDKLSAERNAASREGRRYLKAMEVEKNLRDFEAVAKHITFDTLKAVHRNGWYYVNRKPIREAAFLALITSLWAHVHEQDLNCADSSR